MNIAFRVDASFQIGTGHVMRCLTLAEELKSKGANVIFICRKHKGHLNNKIRSNGFYVSELEYSETKYLEDELAHSDWLGKTQLEDAKECIKILKFFDPEMVIVDHYAINETWELKLKEVYNKIMIIDDLADRKHQCDILLDQNLFINMSTRYQDRIPDNCIQLLGPKYALLNPIYANLRRSVRLRSSPLESLLVFFGGVDRQNLTGLVLLALERINLPFERVDVVISKDSEHYQKIQKQVLFSSKIILHSDLPSLAHLMKSSDVAIGGGGSAHWERICLGLPSLVITLAENQRFVNQDLSNLGIVELIGDVCDIGIEHIIKAIKNVLSRRDIVSWSKLCMDSCSGLGVSIVADEILKN